MRFNKVLQRFSLTFSVVNQMIHGILANLCRRSISASYGDAGKSLSKILRSLRWLLGHLRNWRMSSFAPWYKQMTHRRSPESRYLINNLGNLKLGAYKFAFMCSRRYSYRQNKKLADHRLCTCQDLVD